MSATDSKRVQGEESRRRLVDAAAELIAGGGYAGTSVEAIALRAGVVKSALYWHFGSKRGLLLAAIRRETDAWVEEAFGAAFGRGAPMERLEDLINRVERVIVEASQTHRLMLSLLLELGGEDAEVRETVAGLFATTRRALADGLRASLPGLDEVAAQGIAEAFTAQVDGLLLRYIAEPESGRLGDSLWRLRRMVLLEIEHELEKQGQGEAA